MIDPSFLKSLAYPTLRLLGSFSAVMLAVSTSSSISCGFPHLEESDDPEVISPSKTQEGSQDPQDEGCVDALVTAYTKDCHGCSGITADGTTADSSLRIIAADRRHWKMGTRVRLFFPDGDVRVYTVRDTGGLIRGRCRFDMLVGTEEFAIKWGRKNLRFETVRSDEN